MQKSEKTGGGKSPHLTYKYVGPECNALVMPNNTKVVPTALTQREIKDLISKFPVVAEYWTTDPS